MNKELKRKLIYSLASSNAEVKVAPKDHLELATKPGATCSDDWTLYVKSNAERITSFAYLGHGCTLSKAALGGIAIKAKEVSKHELKKILEHFRVLILTGKVEQELDELMVFDHVYTLPNRVECALLGANALLKYLKENCGS